MSPPVDADLPADARPTPRVEALKAKVVLVGAPGVGKTSLVRRYVMNAFDDRYRATLGVVVSKRPVSVRVDGRPVRVTMTLWDTMGAPRAIDAPREVYLLGTQGVLAVCDATDEGTVPALRPWFDAIGGVAGDVPVHILLNKADLGAREDARRAALDAAHARGVVPYLTSAKAGDSVVPAFEDLARRIVGRALVRAEDADFGIALSCASPRTAADVAAARGIPVVRAEAHLERLRRRGYVRIASLTLDGDGRPRIAYEATQAAFLDPLSLKKG